MAMAATRDISMHAAGYSGLSMDASTDSEAASDVGAHHLPQPSMPGGRLVAVGFGIAALLLATAAMVKTSRAYLQSRSEKLWSGTFAVSEAAAVDNTWMGMGCTNWQVINIGGAISSTTKDKCVAMCQTTQGCKYANFQDTACSEDKGVDAGTCFLFTDGCDMEVNDCWDLYEAPGPATFSLTSPDAGCENWQTIHIGGVLLDKTVASCAALCKMNDDCVNFNFQMKGDDTCAEGEGLKRGACYLFRAGCTVERNTCWDLYTMGDADDVLGVCPDSTGTVYVTEACTCGSEKGTTCKVGEACTAGNLGSGYCEVPVCPAALATQKCKCEKFGDPSTKNNCEEGGVCSADTGECTYKDCDRDVWATTGCTCKGQGSASSSSGVCLKGEKCELVDPTDANSGPQCLAAACPEQRGMEEVEVSCSCGDATCHPPARCKNAISKNMCVYPACPNVDGTEAITEKCQCGDESSFCDVDKKCYAAIEPPGQPQCKP